MQIQGKDIIALDYSYGQLPASVKEFQPTVYKDGNKYSCILGADAQKGIFGTGATVEEAIDNWMDNFEERLEHPLPADEVVQYILDSRSISKKDVW